MNYLNKILLSITIFFIILIILYIFITIPSEEFKNPLVFKMDDENNTLTVLKINSPNLIWDDILFYHSLNGSAELPVGKIQVGDVITYCQGEICLLTKNSGDIIGIWNFSYEPKPNVSILYNQYTRNITIQSIDSENEYLWDNIITSSTLGDVNCILPEGIIQKGDNITNLSGSGFLDIIWKPSNSKIKQIVFDENMPGLKFEQNNESSKVIITSVNWIYDANWSQIDIDKYPSTVNITKPTGIISIDDEILINNLSDICDEMKNEDEMITITLSWSTIMFANEIESFSFDCKV